MNHEVTYFETLKEVSWFLRLEKPENCQKVLKNLKKNCNFYKKIAETCDIKKLENNPWPTQTFQ